MAAERSRLRLADGITFIVNASPDKLVEEVREALETGQWLAVVNEDGVSRNLNPAHVIYVEPMTRVVEE